MPPQTTHILTRASCVILRDRMLLLLPDEEGAHNILQTVKESFAEMATDMPFEYRAIEGLFESVIRVLDNEFHSLSNRVARCLHRLHRYTAGAWALL